MKNFTTFNTVLKSILVILLIQIGTFSNGQSDYYWVGGSGNWSDHNNHWATISGGAVFHNQVPTPFDNVFFDANSFTAAGQTVTLDVEAFCNDFTFSGVLHQPTITGVLKNVNVDGNFLIENNPFTYNITGKLLVGGNFTILNMPATMVFTHGNDLFEIGGDFLISASQLDYNNNSTMTVGGSFTIDGSDMDYNFQSGTCTVGENFTITNSAMYYRHYGTFSVGQDFLVEESNMYFYHVNGNMTIGTSTYPGNLTFRNDTLKNNTHNYLSNGYTNVIYGDYIMENVQLPTHTWYNYGYYTIHGDFTLENCNFNQFYQANYWMRVYGDYAIIDGDPKYYQYTNLYLHGSFELNDPSITFNKTGYIYFYATDTGNTITSSSHNLQNVQFNGAGGEWTFQDDFWITGTAQMVTGHIISNGNGVDFGDYFNARSWSNVKTMDFTGTDTIFVNRYFYIYNNPTTQNLIMDNAVLQFDYAGNADMTLYGGGQEYNDIIFNHTWNSAGARTVYIRDNNNNIDNITLNASNGTGLYFVNSQDTVGDVTINYLNPTNSIYSSTWNRSDGVNVFGDWTINKTGRLSAGIYLNNNNVFNTMTIPEGARLYMRSGYTQTMNALNATGTCLERINMRSISAGAQADLSISSGTVNPEYLILRDINATGGATFIADNTVDQGNNTGWTAINPPAGNDFYWIGDAGNWNDPAHWSFSSGGTSANCVPIFTDNVIFDDNSFTVANQSVTLDVAAVCNNMTWTSGVLSSPNFIGSPALTINGNLNIDGDMDWTQSGVVTIYGDMSVTSNAIWSHANQLTLYGSISLSTGMSWSNPNWTYFYATDAGHTIDMGGHEFNYHVRFYSQDGNNGEWTLANDFKVISSRYTDHVAGKFISAGFGVDFGYQYYARGWSNAKNLDFTGTDTIFVDRNFQMYNNPTTQTLDMGDAVLKFEYASSSHFNFYPGGQTYNDVVFDHLWTTTSSNYIYIRDNNSTFGNIYATINNGTGIYVTGGGNTFSDVNIHYPNPGAYSYNTTWNRSAGVNTFGDYTITKVGKASVGLYTDNANTWGVLTVPSLARLYFRYGKTQTMDNLVANGLCDEIITLQSTSNGTQATISVATDTVKIDNVTLKDMNATGGAIFEASNVNDLGNNTGWTIIPAPSLTFYWINGAGNWNDANHWSLSSGGPVAGCIPQFKDDVVFDDLSFSAASEAATVNVNFEIRNMTWTSDVVGTPNLNGSSQLIINGDVNVDGPMNWSQSGVLFLRGSLILNSDMTWNHTNWTYFATDNTGNLIDMAGQKFLRNIRFTWQNTVGAADWTLLDDLKMATTSYEMEFYSGTLVSNGFNIDAGLEFDAYFNYSKTFDFTGTDSISMRRQWRIYPTNQTTEVTTLTIDTATIYITTSGNESIQFYGGNHAYYDVVINSNYTWAWPQVNLRHNNTYRDVSIFTHGLHYVYIRDMVNSSMRDLYIYNDGSYSNTNVNFRVYFNQSSAGGNTFRDVTIESGNNGSRFNTFVYGNVPNIFRDFKVIQPAEPLNTNYIRFDQSNIFETLELDKGFDLHLNGSITQTVDVFIPHSECNYRSRIRGNNATTSIISQASGTVNAEWITLTDHTVTGGATFNATDATVTGTINGWNAVPEPPHNLYWVGDNGNWNDPDHWALASGGAGNGCLIPTIRDNVFFDGNSFSGTGKSVNMNTTGLCKNMIWNGASANEPTFSGGGQLSIHGDLVVADNMTWSQSGNLYLHGSMTLNTDMSWNHSNWTRFISTDTDNTLDMAGQTFKYHVEFNGIGGEWILQDDYNFNNPTSYYTDYNAGSFVSNGYSVNFGYQMDANNTGVKSWDFTGTETVNVGRIWRVNGTNSSLNMGDALLLMEWSSNNALDFYGGGLVYNDLEFDHNYTGNQNIKIHDGNTFNNVFFYPTNEKTITINGDHVYNDVLIDINNNNVSTTTEVYFNGTSTFNNFILLSPGTSGPFIYFYEDNTFNSFVSGGRGSRFYLGANKTQYVNNELVLGTGSNPVFLFSTVDGVQANIEKNGGDVCLDFVWLQDQNASGTATFFAGASSTDLGNNTNWIFGTSCLGYYWVGNSGDWSDNANHWATSSGGTTFHLLPPDQSDNVWFDVNSFTTSDAVVNIDVADPRARDMNWQSAFYTPTLVGTADSISLHGELKFTSAMNMDWEGEWIFKSAENTSTHAINTAGHTLTDVNFAGPGALVNTVGNWQLENNLTVTNSLTLERGNLLTDDRRVTTKNFNVSTSQDRTLDLGASEIFINDGAFNVSNSNNLTINPGTSEIIVQSEGGSSDFIGAGLTYNDLTFATNSAMSGDLLGSNTFNTLKFEPGVTVSIEPVTQVTSDILADGSCQQEITINSTVPGTQATFSQASGSVDISFVNLKDNNATGGAVFTANLSNNLGNVSGWNFSSNPVLDLTINKTDATCPLPSNGTATAVVTGGTAPITYLWSTLSIEETVSGLVPGTYSVIATDANGCEANESVTIEQPASFDFGLTLNSGEEICFEASNGTAAAIVDPIAVEPLTYLWSNSEASSSISDLVAGTYTLTVTDAVNCAVTESVTVEEGIDLDAQFQVEGSTCDGNELQFSGDGNGVAFSHSFDGTTIDNALFTYDNIGVYTQNDELSVTGSCAWNKYFYTNQTFPRLDGSTLTMKYYHETSAQSMVGWHGNNNAGGNRYVNMIYSFYFSSNTISIYEDGSNRGNFSGSVSGGVCSNCWYDIKIVLKDQGAVYYIKKQEDENYTFIYDSNYSTESDIRAGFTYAACGAGAYTDDWEVSSRTTNGYTFDWDFGDGNDTSGLASVAYTYASPGTYEVEFVLTDSLGCADTATKEVVVNEAPTVNAVVTDASCADVCDGSVSLSFSGGTPPYNFSTSDFAHTFDGTTLDLGLFTKDNIGTYTQNDQLTVQHGSGWNKFIYTNETFEREVDKEFNFRYYQPANAYNMIGWYGNSTGSNNYYDLIYAFYFNNNNSLYIYEDGGQKANVSGILPGGTTYNTWYDGKIVLKTNGADYYLKKDGQADYTLIYSSNYSTETNLRVGMTYYGSGTVITDDWFIQGDASNPDTLNLCPGEYTYVMSDSIGCQGSITVNVGVSDTLLDAIVCNDINLQLEASGTVTVTAADIDGGSADSCGIDTSYVSGTQISFDCDDLGQTFTVQLHVVDINGNEDSCTAQVTIVDDTNPCNQPPIANCMDITVSADGNCEGTAMAEDFDNDTTPSSDPDGDQITFTVDPVGPYALGSTPVTITVSDGSLTATCTATITVEDNTDPEITCPDDVTVSTDTGSCEATGVNLGTATVTDNCSTITPTNDAPASYVLGANTVTWTADDGNGNVVTCTQTVTVEDNEDPVITCPDDVTVSTDTGTCEATGVSLGSATATDNCATITPTNDAPASYALGTNTVTWTADDGSGNVVTCIQTVTVEDNEAPSAICQDITVQLDALGNASITPADINNGSSDACGIMNITIDNSSFTCADEGNNTVTLTVEDNNGNISTCSSTVTVEDNVDPVAICQDITVQLDDLGNASIIADDIDNGSFDACEIQSITLDDYDFDCSDVGGEQANNYALDFDGSNDWVKVSDKVSAASLGLPTSEITLESWVNPKSYSIWRSMVSFFQDNGSFERGWDLETRSGGRFAFALNSVGGGGGLTYMESTNSFSTNEWHHVAGVYDGTTMKIYIDGQLENTSTAENGDIWYSDAWLALGMYKDDNENFSIPGTLDEIRIWNIARSQAEIQATMNTTLSGSEPGLVAYYAFEDGPGSTIVSDLSGNGLTGTLTNMDPATDWIAGSTVSGSGGGALVTMTVTDNNGNTSTCAANVTVEDNVDPIAICQDITIQLDAGGNASITANDVNNGSNDACGIDTVQIDITAFDCGDVGPNTVILTVTDVNGNVSTCASAVTVEDNVDPIAICQDITVELDENGEVSIIPADIDNGSNDACGLQPLSINVSDFDCSNVGDNTVVLTVTDVNGNFSICESTVTVEDNEAPTFSQCPLDQTVEATAGDCSQLVSWLIPLVDDNCGAFVPVFTAPGINIVALGPSALGQFPVGTTTVTMTVTDQNNNVSSCTFDITVEDTQVPIITNCPGDIIVNADAGSCDAEIIYPGVILASDNCPGVILDAVSGHNIAGGTFAVGTTNVLFRATDAVGLITECAYTVTVVDAELPVVTCQDVTVSLDALGDGSITANDVFVGATDNCEVNLGSLAVDVSGFDCSNVGTNTVTVSIEDIYGNVGTCTATVTVIDEVDPEALCNNLTIDLDANGEATITAAQIDNGSNDACGIQSVTIDNDSFDCFNTGANSVVLTIVDDNGNVSTCTSTVTVQDIEFPSVTCPGDIAVNNDITICGAVVDFTATADDNCGVEITYSQNPGTLFPVGSTTVTVTATDPSGNATECTFDVTVTDNEDPVLVCPADITLDADNGACEATGFILESSEISDNCDIATFTNDAQTSYPVGVNSVLYVLEDIHGNVTTCTQLITVVDNQAPSVTCNDITIDLPNRNDYTLSQADIDAIGLGSSDNCTDISFAITDGVTVYNCDDRGEVFTVTLTVSDLAGNESTCTATVTIIDSQSVCNDPPIALCQDIITYTDENCEAYITAAEIDGGSTDPDGDDLTLTLDNYGPFGVGTYTVELSVSDGEYTETCTATVTVEDNTNPVIDVAASNETIECDGAGNTAALNAWLASNGGASASDACGVEWTNDFTALSDECGVTGSATVTFTVTDPSSNSASTTAIFTIEDTTNPTIAEVAEDETVECDGDGNTAELDAWLAANGGAVASDVCSGVIWSNDFTGLSDECGATGSATVTFTATDDCDNSSSTTAIFTIEDTTNPTIAGVAEDETVECDGAGNTAELDAWLAANGGAIASDVCSGVIWSNDFTGLSDECGAAGSATVTFTATDDCDNSSSTTATFTIEDTTNPTIAEVAEDETVECDGAGNTAELDAWLAANGGAVASDVCSGVIWSNDFTGLSDECGATGSATVTFTATDDCDNSSSTTAIFTIEDTTNPTIAEVAEDETVECDGAGNTAELDAWLAANGGAIASDVCSGVTWSNDFTILSDECGATGSATVTFTATDDCDNSSSTTATFTIEDTTNPTIAEVAEDETVECDGAGNTAELDAWLAANGGAVASDVCSGVIWSNDFTILSDECGATGSATVTFTATDDCDNSSSTTAIFTIEDTTNPTIAEVAIDKVVECDGAGNTAELDAWLAANGGAIASDVCSGVSWSNDFTILSDECGATGSATVTFTATDDCNNSSTTTAIFTIEDTANPIVAEVAIDKVVECDGAGNIAELNAWLDGNGGAYAFDLCGEISWSNDFTGLSDECGATGSATVTFTATDDCNNSSSTTATFTIEDTTNPTIAEVAEDKTVECDGSGNTAELDAWLAANGGAIASDVCSGVIWSNDFTGLSDECGATGSATVTFTATDDCNNSSTTTAIFTIEDTANPIIAEVAIDKVVECDGAGNIAELNAWLDGNGGAYAFDLCGEISWSNDFTGLSDECGATGSATVTFTATDDCNNSSTTTATFTIEDTMNPTIAEEAEDETVECDGSGNTAELDAWLAANGGAIASDVCSGVIWSNDFTGLSDECGATGSATVTFTATDDCDNSSSTTAIFTIEDTIPPAMTCPDDIAICADQVLVTGSAVSWIPPVPLDICSSVNLVSTHEPGDTFPVGITTVTYTATDECGLETECSFDIEVYELPEVNITESELPIFCQNNVVVLTANVVSNTGGITYDWSIGNSTDTVEVSASGIYEVTVTDANGCERSTSYDVTVDTTGLLSAYTILGIDEVHLHDNNVVVNGGVGVLDDDGKAKIQQNTMITGSTTFVIADDIEVKSGSVVTKQFEGTPNVTLPEFLYNPFGSDNDVTVNSGDTVTLTDQVYGKVDIKEGATVIFTQQDIFIEDLKTKDDVTIQFSGCTFMRIEKNLNLDDDILFNPDGYSVNVYVDANVEVKEGAQVRASIYANDHNINVNGKEDNQTYMYGRFIGKKIDGHKYVNWDWSTACDPTCEPGDPPVVYSCDCDNGMVSLSLVYDGPAGATVEAWYYGNTSLGTFYDVQPGDTLLVDATTIGEDKLKSNTSFYVDGGSEIEFHTSCSDDILNDTINELTVVGWVDGYNQTCGEGGTGIIPELPCNCEDGMVSLSLVYDGPAGATVEAWYYGNTSLGTFYDVQPGDTLLVDATTIGEDKLKSNTSFYVDGGSEIEFHTSCSEDILYETIDELTVVGWVDGEDVVCSDGGTGDYPEIPIDCECDGGMVTLSLEYNGPAGVTIEAYYNANTSLGTFYDVQPGDIIMVDATSIGKDKLKSKTSFYVDGGSEIEFHTSCSQDIYDETIDELTVTGWEDKYGNICPPEDSYDNDNGNDEVLHVLHAEVTDLELNPNLTTREVNIPFDLESKIDVFPNPAYGRVNISVTSPDKDIELLFLDRLGRKVWIKTISKEGESSLISVDIQNFSSGVYVIHATLDGKLHTKRLVIIE